MRREFTYGRSKIWVISSQYQGKFRGANTELGVERGKRQTRRYHSVQAADPDTSRAPSPSPQRLLVLFSLQSPPLRPLG